MDLQQAINLAYLEAMGKDAATTPLTSSKYNMFVSYAQAHTMDWQNEDGIEWSSLYLGPVNCGTISATDTYTLDSSIRVVSTQEDDWVVVVLGSGNSQQTWLYDVVPATMLNRYRYDTTYADTDPFVYSNVNQYAVCGQLGEELIFANAFQSTDPQINGALTVPGFGFATLPVSAGDAIVVDDPMWLVYMMAADFARNDVVKQVQYPNLLAKANERMTAMKRRNEVGQLSEIPNEMYMYGTGETWY